MEIDLLRNRNPQAPLGPFDGRVGSIVRVGGDTFFVTSNVDYVPELPDISKTHAVYFHRDSRFGKDDPTLWPQQLSRSFYHLAVMPRRESHPHLAIMWYTPTLDDHECLSSITRGLGRLRFHHFVKIRDLALALLDRVVRYLKSLPPNQSPYALLIALNMGLEYGLTRLESLALTFDKMVVTLTAVQRYFLELTAFLDFVEIYKPRIDLVDVNNEYKNVSVVEECMGGFTADVTIASELFRAKLPFWLVRPLHVFANENILSMVSTTSAPISILQGSVQADTDHLDPIYTGNSTSEKMIAMHTLLRRTSYYRDIFASFESPAASFSVASTAASSSKQPSHPPPSAPVRSPTTSQRYAPYALAQDGGNKSKKGSSKGPKKVDHDPYLQLESPEMPDYIPVWSAALGSVNKTGGPPSVTPFTLPEPALFASAENPQRRAKFLHHWRVVQDAILYLISVDKMAPLSNQDWRDILEGLVKSRGHAKSRTGKRSRSLAVVLEPLIAGGLLDQNALAQLPVPPGSIPHYTVKDFRRTIWQVAEINFRFELASIDRRASSLDRLEDVRMCFPGGQLESVPLELATRGFASASPDDHLRYFIRVGKLMLDWRTRTRRPNFLDAACLGKPDEQWSALEQEQLETAVAQYYTQSFYENFGRAAVLPMRLSSDDITTE
ncbi:hypothetical protein FB45DRAFT_1037933 [Roridomyces roridus]|uniref:Uncharacterized protein n=1 Tax=Roridomyces roridus TaxID=1738132 RepID=A0AAD7B532_9AGAR|nr:hypothetical protein FB45DRAFT_1037933 [Roridomyces roridus]